MSSASCSSSTLEKETLLIGPPLSRGAHLVKYQPQEEWDFSLETAFQPIDISLVLPHYRARNQPLDHRMNMFIAGDSEPIKVKTCRQRQGRRSKFYLEILSNTSDITVWLPSDFNGSISHSGKASFSAGFVNRIMRHCRINEDVYEGDSDPAEDEVVLHTRGRVTFRMWDVITGTSECVQKEALKRMFGCGKQSPETTIDWDFLLEG